MVACSRLSPLNRGRPLLFKAMFTTYDVISYLKHARQLAEEELLESENKAKECRDVIAFLDSLPIAKPHNPEPSMLIVASELGELPNTEERICLHCGKKFMQKPTLKNGKQQIYCSKHCNQNAYTKRKRDANGGPTGVIESTCAYCGKKFTYKADTHRGRPRKYCSEGCGKLDWQKNNRDNLSSKLEEFKNKYQVKRERPNIDRLL